MRQRNSRILVIIFFTIAMAVCPVLIMRSANESLSEYDFSAANIVAGHYILIIIAVALAAFVIISQSVRLIERKPEMYKYDLPLATMNEYAEKLQLQQSKNEMYSAIVQTLSSEYGTVYFVNFDTEDYLKYTLHKEYNILWLDERKRYFFTRLYSHLMRMVDKNDRDIVESAVTKENMLAQLDRKKDFFVKFRSVKGGVTSYYILKAVYFINEDSNHLVVGLKNLNDAIQSETEYKEAVGQAIEMAVVDELTGMKNRNAYVKHEYELEMNLKDNRDIKFAFVVLDVNGLKDVNDTNGHKAGDALLKKASELIGEHFKGNDMYRIGGDEFAVILLGDAYEEREALLESFRTRILLNKNNGDAIIASGMAEYEPDTDPDAEAVFDRADADMYRNKIELKMN